MENTEVSIHEVRVFCALRAAAPQWLTSADVAHAAQVAPRTARHHLLRFAKLQIVDVMELFPRHRYQLAKMAGKRNSGYMRRLLAAVEVIQPSSR